MRNRLVILPAVLCLICGMACAADVTVNYDNAALDDILANLTRQSGRQIVRTGNYDGNLSLHLSNVPLEQALDAIASGVGGIVSHEANGYRVFPRPPVEYVLGLVKHNYSHIQDVEIVTPQEAWTWKAPNLSRLQRSVTGKAQGSLSVSQGADKWTFDEDEITKSQYQPVQNGITYFGPGFYDAIGFLANPQAVPGLTCASVKKSGDRIVYVLESQADRPKGRQYYGGQFLWGIRGTEYAFLYPRPQPDLFPPDTDKFRIEVDALTGVALAGEIIRPMSTRRTEAEDIREAAPGILLPYRSVSKKIKADGTETNLTDVTAKTIRVNINPDEKLFTVEPPRDAFISDMTISTPDKCRELLKAQPDDPDLHYRLGQILSGQSQPAEAVKEFRKAAELRLAAKKVALIAALNAASQAKPADETNVLISELRSLAPKDTQATFAIASALSQLGQKDQAMSEYGQSVALYPGRPDAPLLQIAQLAEELGDRDRAERLYLEIIQTCDVGPCVSAAARLRAMYAGQGMEKSLIKPLEEALKRLKEPPSLLCEYGALLMVCGRTEAGMNACRRVIDESPNTAIVTARELRREKRYPEARELLIAAITLGDDACNKMWATSELTETLNAEGISIEKTMELYAELTADADGNTARQVYAGMAPYVNMRNARARALEKVLDLWKKNSSNLGLSAMLANLATPRWIGDTDLDLAVAYPAMKQLLNVIRDKPELYAAFGEICLSKGEYQEAIEAFQKGAELDPEQPYYPAELAYAYVKAGSGRGAIDTGRALLAKDTGNATYHLVLGCAYYSAGQYPNALADFTASYQLLQDGKDASGISKTVMSQTLEAIISCYTKLKDPDAAVKYMQLAVDTAASDRDKALAMARIARFYASTGNMDKAVAGLMQIEQAFPREISADVVRASRYELSKEDKQTLSVVMSSMLQGKSGFPLCKLLLAELYAEASQVAPAQSIFSEVLTANQNDLTVLRRLGDMCRWGDAFHGRVQEIYKKLVELEPERKENHVYLADAYVNAGQSALAVEEARTILRKWPADSYAVTSAGSILRKLGQWDEALQVYREALESDRRNADEYEFGIALVYKGKGRIDDANDLLSNILERTRDDYRKLLCLDELTDIAKRRGDDQQAMGYLKQTIELAKNDWQKTNALRDMAGIYKKIGDNKQAVRCLQEVITLTKNDWEKQNAQREIDQLMGVSEPPPN